MKCGYFAASGTWCLESVQNEISGQSRILEMCCPVPESLVSVTDHYFFNMIMSQNTQITKKYSDVNLLICLLRLVSLPGLMLDLQHMMLFSSLLTWSQDSSTALCFLDERNHCLSPPPVQFFWYWALKQAMLHSSTKLSIRCLCSSLLSLLILSADEES